MFEVKSTNGDTFLGGEDFDDEIVNYLISEFKKDNGINLKGDKLALQRLKEAAEKAKIELSSATQTEINLPFLTADKTGPKHLNLKFTRAKLEALVENLIEKTLAPCKTALKDSGFSAAEINEVVLVGGGHTHALFLRMWGMRPLPGVQISLISPSAETTYTGMLPGFVAGHYSKEDISIDLMKLCRFAGARFIISSVNNIFPVENLISIQDRASLRYDVASIDIGVTSKLSGSQLSNSNTYSIRPLGDFVDRWVNVKEKIINDEIPPEIVVIGGGIGAVEIAMAMAFSLKSLGVREYNITIIDKSNGLNGIRPQTRKALLVALDSFAIKTLNHSEVLEVTETEVRIKTYPAITSNFTVVAAGASPYAWLKQCDLVLKNGFVEVDSKLRAVGLSNVFAVGDCAHLVSFPVPKAGVFAVRQAPILFKNICAELLKRPLKKFSPQKNYLKF